MEQGLAVGDFEAWVGQQFTRHRIVLKFGEAPTCGELCA